MNEKIQNINIIETFGCRLNTFESEVIRGHLPVDSERPRIVFNTCAVTAEAERQARQAIRRARRNNPNAEIIVTGCAAQINPGDFEAMPEVDRRWYKEQMAGGQAVHIAYSKKGLLLASFLKSGINFSATVKTEKEVEEALKIILSYRGPDKTPA